MDEESNEEQQEENKQYKEEIDYRKSSKEQKEDQDFIKGRILGLNPPIEKKFGAFGTLAFLPFRIVEIPSGYDLVKFDWGIAKKRVKEIKDTKGNVVGYERNPAEGLKMIWGLYGLYQTGVVLDTRIKQKNICAQNVLTRDGLEIEQLDAIMNYRIFDAYLASTNASIKREEIEKLVNAVGKAQVVSHAGSNKLVNLIEEARKTGVESRINIAPALDSTDYKELHYLGLEIKGIYLENVNIPNELREKIAQEAIARSEAEAIRLRANARADEQVRLAEAEKDSILKIVEGIREQYGLNKKDALEKYLQLKELDIHENISKREGATTYFHLPEIVNKFTKAITGKEAS